MLSFSPIDFSPPSSYFLPRFQADAGSTPSSTGPAVGTLESGDVAVARAAFFATAKHETYFARVFAQAEWAPCD